SSWRQREKIKLVHVAYKGGAQAVLDLVAGHVEVGMLTWSIVAEHVRAGRPLALATTLGAAAAIPCGDSDVARTGAPRFRGDDVVFALGPCGPCSRCRRERQPRGRQCLDAAAAQTPHRARRDRNQSDEPGRADPLHAERDRPLDADDQAPAWRKLAPVAYGANAGAPARGIRRSFPRPAACTLPADAALPPIRSVRRPAAPGLGFAGQPAGCSRRSAPPASDGASRPASPARRCWRWRMSRASSGSWAATRAFPSTTHCSGSSPLPMPAMTHCSSSPGEAESPTPPTTSLPT